MSLFARTRTRAALALLALIGQLTPAVALPVFAATATPHRQASCSCLALTALAQATCTPDARADKRGCCGCCGPKADGAPAACSLPKPEPRPADPNAPSVKSNDTCACAKPNPASASEPAVPADAPVAPAVRPSAEPLVPQSAPPAPFARHAPPAPPPRA